MKKDTDQQNFWTSQFGQDYTERMIFDPQSWDDFSNKTYGLSRTEMNNEFLKNLPIANILEVGCNVGNQLLLLQAKGYKNIYGIDIQDYAVERAKALTKNINIIQGSAFDLPFRDSYFDLVFTTYVLIHIHPQDVKEVMKEIYRVSKKYIWGLEYYNDKLEEIEYRGNKNCLWKTDFVKLYQDTFPNLKLVKEKRYPYLDNSGRIEAMFLLEKN